MDTKADLLVETLFSLDEPWQSNFLSYMAERVIGDTWEGGTPKREEVSTWLGNQRLLREVELLLNSWRGLRPL